MKLYQAEKIFLGSYENPGTRQSSAETTRKLVDALGSNRDVSEVSPAELHIFIQELREQKGRWADHPTRPHTEGGLSPATLDKHVRVTKRFFKFLVELEILSRSPAESLKQTRNHKAVGRAKALTPEEIHILLGAAFGDRFKDALINFLVDTGCRVGGVASLKVPDLDVHNRRALVTEKGNKSRPVFYSESTARKLTYWLILRPICNHEYVFGTETGPRTPEAISQMIRRLAAKAGIKRPVGAHSIRHAVAYALSDSGVSPTVAASILGHENPETTMRYYYPKDFVRAEMAMRDLHDKRNRDNRPIEMPRAKDSG